jgi:hypothetical protein
MNLRQRYWLMSALLVLMALGSQRARGQEVPMGSSADRNPAVVGSPHAGGLGASVVPPTDLSSQDAAYWLRQGNQLQRAGRESDALQAYLRATQTPVPGAAGANQSSGSTGPAGAADAEARAKAWLNIALLHVSQASLAIDELDALRVGSLRGVRSDAARQVGAQRHRAYRAASEALGIEVPSVPVAPVAPSAAQAAQLNPSTPPTQAFEPYTVDRWIALPKRASVRPSTSASSGRSAVVEPITESPLPPAPQVERLQGFPPAAGR